MRRFMAAQLRKPNGWFGSVVMSRMLNRVNRKIIATTLDLLEVQPGNAVLEIGFGGGIALKLLLRQSRDTRVTGIDLSTDMVALAQRKFRRDIQSGRVSVQRGDITQLPFPDVSFDRVFTINTAYFWPEPARGAAELCRVLKPGGRAAISIRSKDRMGKSAITQYNFRLYSAEDVVDLMRAAGFRDIHFDERDRGKAWDQVIVIGTR